jgi:hypothetical protein
MTQLPFNPSKIYEEIHSAIQEAGIDSMSESAWKMAEIMYRTLMFSRAIVWRDNPHVFLAQTPRELINIYRLRYDVYLQMGYAGELPNEVDGLDFDGFDEYSAILYTKNASGITSTCRVIFDSNLGLPVEQYHSFDAKRKEKKRIAELSRLAKLDADRGLGREFQYLVRGAYYTIVDNDMDTLVSAMIPEHFKFYQNFGGFAIEGEIEHYGGLGIPFVVTAWDVAKISRVFRRIFLGERQLASKCGHGLDELVS